MHLIITGTSNGIGKALAELALKKQNRVLGISRRNLIEDSNYTHLQVNLALFEEVKNIAFPKNQANKIVLVNNAGTLGEINYLGNLSNESIHDSLVTNLISPTILINKFIQTYAHIEGLELLIINISSGAGNHAYDGWSEYCCSKAGIEMLTKVVEKESVEKGRKNIKILSVYPGIVETGMQKSIRSSSKDAFSMVNKFADMFAQGVNKTPQKSAEEIYDVIENTHAYTGPVVDFWQVKG